MLGEWRGRAEGPRVAVLQIGVTERARVACSSVDGGVCRILPKLTKCRAERVRIGWYGGVLSAVSLGATADTVVSVLGT